MNTGTINQKEDSPCPLHSFNINQFKKKTSVIILSIQLQTPQGASPARWKHTRGYSYGSCSGSGSGSGSRSGSCSGSGTGSGASCSSGLTPSTCTSYLLASSLGISLTTSACVQYQITITSVRVRCEGMHYIPCAARASVCVREGADAQ